MIRQFFQVSAVFLLMIQMLMTLLLKAQIHLRQLIAIAARLLRSQLMGHLPTRLNQDIPTRSPVITGRFMSMLRVGAMPMCLMTMLFKGKPAKRLILSR